MTAAVVTLILCGAALAVALWALVPLDRGARVVEELDPGVATSSARRIEAAIAPTREALERIRRR